jgi:hypothetical protein
MIASVPSPHPEKRRAIARRGIATRRHGYRGIGR